MYQIKGQYIFCHLILNSIRLQDIIVVIILVKYLVFVDDILLFSTINNNCNINNTKNYTRYLLTYISLLLYPLCLISHFTHSIMSFLCGQCGNPQSHYMSILLVFLRVKFYWGPMIKADVFMCQMARI